jgi:ATP-dependent RNA/DNA helicase IGHMBP2
VHPHLQSLHDALKVEERAQAEELRRLDLLAHDEQIAVGHAWPELRIRGVERAGRTVRVLAAAPRGVELHEGIGLGESVWITVHGTQRPGWLESRDDATAEVRVEGDEPPDGAPARIRRRHDPSTFARYREALERADVHRSDLRRVLLGERPPPAITTPVALPGLDGAQQLAAGVAIRAPELALVHGPPGTGKTHLLGAVLDRLVADGDRPWALADSNAAVDHLALEAHGRGLRVVRLGPIARFRPEVVALALETQLREGPLGPALTTIERDLKRAWGTPEWRPLWVERDRIRDQAKAHAIAEAQVVATTFGTLARLGPTLPPPVTAVVDEATQAIEPAVWAAVPYIRRLVLVGDPHQLGPVVRTRGNPLEVSLLERLVATGMPMPMLQVQHRMPTRVRELVADVYGPTYVDAAHLSPGDDATVVFVDTAGQGAEERDPATGSMFEPAELEVVRSRVAALRAEGVAASEIAVITPYSAQVARLLELPELAGVGVGTVNAWQGREARVVIVSFVRSNPDGDVGFLADDRRLTVALTRAKERLILVGDSGTLARMPRYARLLQHLAERGALRSVWE